jgi:hypothetical protein
MELWQNLASLYELQVEQENLEEKIKELSSEVYVDKTVKTLKTVHSPDNKVWLRQSLAHDAMIITFLINSKKGTEIDNPVQIWNDFYKQIAPIKSTLNFCYYSSTVLQTIINHPVTDDGTPTDQYLAGLLKSEFEPYKAKKYKSAELPIGKLWQFGDNHKFMFALYHHQEDEASMFLANEFPFIISLMGKIENHYILAVKLYETLNEMERSTRDLELNMVDILACEDAKMLESKREEISLVGKNAIETLSTIRICGNNINANIKNLKTTVPLSSIKNDEFLNDLLEKYEEFEENIKTWSEVGENMLMRITKYVDDTKLKLTELIQQEQLKSSLKKMPEHKKPYTTAELESEFQTDIQKYDKETQKILEEAFLKAKQKGPEVMEWGSNYLFYEDDPTNCFDLFKVLCQSNFETLCITRQHPDKMKKKYELEDHNPKVFWLSTASCEFCLPPTLTRISHELSKFMKEKKKRIIMFDGLEFLVNHNDFFQVLKFFDSTKENIILNDSLFLISISPAAFSPKELTLLRKNMNTMVCKPISYDFSKLEEEK